MSLNFPYNKKLVTHHFLSYSPHTCGDFYTGVLCNADVHSANGKTFRLFNEGLVKYADYNKYEPEKPSTSLVKSLGDHGLAISKEMLSIVYKTGATDYLETCLDYFTTMLTIKNACEHGKLNDLPVHEVNDFLTAAIQQENNFYHCSMNTGLFKNTKNRDYFLTGQCPYRVKFYTIDIDNPLDLRYTLTDMYYKNSDSRWDGLSKNLFNSLSNIREYGKYFHKVILNPWTTVIERNLDQFPDSDPDIVLNNFRIYHEERITELDQLWELLPENRRSEIQDIISKWKEQYA